MQVFPKQCVGNALRKPFFAPDPAHSQRSYSPVACECRCSNLSIKYEKGSKDLTSKTVQGESVEANNPIIKNAEGGSVCPPPDAEEAEQRYLASELAGRDRIRGEITLLVEALPRARSEAGALPANAAPEKIVAQVARLHPSRRRHGSVPASRGARGLPPRRTPGRASGCRGKPRRAHRSLSEPPVLVAVLAGAPGGASSGRRRRLGLRSAATLRAQGPVI